MDILDKAKSYDVFDKLLKIKGVTTYQVAKATGISPSTFTDWKNKKNMPKTDKLQKIADYFEVTLDYLTTGQVKDGHFLDDETARIAQEMFERPDLKALFDASRKLPPEDIKAVQNMIDLLWKKERPEED